MSPGTTRNLHALGFCILANKSRRRANGESTSESPGWCLVGGGGGGAFVALVLFGGGILLDAWTLQLRFAGCILVCIYCKYVLASMFLQAIQLIIKIQYSRNYLNRLSRQRYLPQVTFIHCLRMSVFNFRHCV